MGRVFCYNHIKYSTDRSSAEVEARCRQHSSITKMEYNWNGKGYKSDSTYLVDQNMKDALSLTVKATDNEGTEFTVSLESPNFMWQNAEVH